MPALRTWRPRSVARSHHSHFFNTTPQRCPRNGMQPSRGGGGGGGGGARLAAGLAVPAAARAVRGRAVARPIHRPRRNAPARRLPAPCLASPPPPDTPSPAGGGESHGLAQRLAAAAAAALVAGGALLSGGGGSASAQPPPTTITATTASVAEDALLSAVRTAQAAGDAVVNSVLNATAGAGDEGVEATADADPARAAAVALLEEVHEVVAQNYVDARG